MKSKYLFFMTSDVSSSVSFKTSIETQTPMVSPSDERIHLWL